MFAFMISLSMPNKGSFIHSFIHLNSQMKKIKVSLLLVVHT